MPSSPNQTQLEAAIAPHLATDDGQRFLQGQANLDDIRSSLAAENPAAGEQFSNLLLKYMWEEISSTCVQTELRALAASNACLQTAARQAQLAPILAAASSESDAKRAICEGFGLVTQKREGGRAGLEEGIRFQYDVEERFKSQPGKYEEFLSAGFGEWREGIDPSEVRARLRGILEGNEDLIRRFETI